MKKLSSLERGQLFKIKEKQYSVVCEPIILGEKTVVLCFDETANCGIHIDANRLVSLPDDGTAN